MRRFAGSLAYHHVGAGRQFGEAQRLHKTRQKDDPGIRLQLPDALDELDAVHSWHAVIGDYNVEGGRLKEFQAFFTIYGNLHAVAHFLEQRSAYQQTVSIVVYEQNVRGCRLGGFYQSECESNKAVIALSTLSHRDGKPRDSDLDK
jgi:hypothetical protein